MSLAAKRVMVGDQPVRVDTKLPDRRPRSRSVLVENTGDTICYLGGPSVTPTQGKTLAVAASVSVDVIRWDSALWAVTASGTTTLECLEIEGA